MIEGQKRNFGQCGNRIEATRSNPPRLDIAKSPATRPKGNFA
jgi:hypothetical protein